MIHKVILSTLLFCVLSATASAELVVVVNKNNASNLDKKTIQRIFLGKDKKFPDGSTATPINQSQESSSRSVFDEEVLGRSSSQVSAYWSKLVFTGKGVPPVELSNDQAVIEKVASNQDAIGYVDVSAVTSDVSVLQIN